MATGGIIPNFEGFSAVSNPAIDFSTMPSPVVTVTDIERETNKVKVYQNSATF